MSATRKLSPQIYEQSQADAEREAPEIPQAAPKYGVTLMIDPGTGMDEVNVHLSMTEGEIENVLCGAHPFIRLPKRYSRHASGYDSGETIYLHIESITQMRISGWPHPSEE